jgi:hypothetical protein
VQIVDVFVFPKALGDQFFLAEIDRNVEIQRVVQNPGAGAKLAHLLIRKAV